MMQDDTQTTITIQHRALPNVEAKLAKLTRRAKKLGIPGPKVSTGIPYVVKRMHPRSYELGWGDALTVKVKMVDLTVATEKVKVAGWTPVATVNHEHSERMHMAWPDQEFTQEMMDTPSGCDHCGKGISTRKRTFFLVNDEGEVKQVGTTCLADFLGYDPVRLVEIASWISELADMDESDEDRPLRGGYGKAGIDLHEYLSWVNAVIGVKGWVSRTRAHDFGLEDTAGLAADAMFDQSQPEGRKSQIAELVRTFTKEDAEAARAAIEWAANLTDEERQGNSYLSNIHVLATDLWCSNKEMGFAASIIAAHQRSMEREEERKRKAEERAAELADKPASQHRGEVKERITLELTLEGIKQFGTDFGITTLHRFRSPDNDLVVWFKSGYADAEAGKTYSVTGTVKAHKQFNGEKQTVLTRCRLKAA